MVASLSMAATEKGQPRDALAALRIDQAKAENLLHSTLPRSIADKLKAETQLIADQFSSASILFANVVERLGRRVRYGICQTLCRMARPPEFVREMVPIGDRSRVSTSSLASTLSPVRTSSVA
jgi:hypothetical protein